MSDHEDLLAPYLLGALEPEERARVEAHLDECSECQAELENLSAAVLALDLASAEAPPPDLRGRVMTQIKPAEVIQLPARRTRWRLGWVAAAVVAALASFAVLTGDPFEDLLLSGDLTTVEFTATEAYGAAPPRADLHFSPSSGLAAVEFEGLQAPEEGKTYELWLINEEGTSAAGIFTPDASGRARVLIQGRVNVGWQVAMTEEPSGGVEVATGEVLFIAGL